MLYPSIDQLMTKVESKYALVVAAARRARRLQEGARSLVSVPSGKVVSVALFEIAADKVKCVLSK
ncbi:DNA-directed RNA polymerase subunit omega [Kyrpidia spormannii]|uniref:DNA-directed RNA polymerase subunit omega n=3 Tax=Kyrpidia TaxID=1129704 RepID=A0A2K8N6X0_9BACL|nr:MULTISPECIES: DNA-directed RNA polymerase subunit omega [Kyrpidia]HHY66225.1 DNA-directed RNA polymerase subunit omega [Alicyclobacillus sp.]ADG06131.1 DNA-directed RNA polymerase, omega subunit [Kyrpidia tusciae DSM 2912]ATY85099.1 DNA-directed RNA polymerase subunit omega [Kyrpidia spormannii]MBE3552958.1 DNA-directed RNA polymerase subunit omega [Kyrpidia tusciae]MCL6575934.1 DNA-directed RNA polymerase subunit omega [Kyrpidia sp.]